MARSKRRSSSQVSFFAFQDIITSVSGILIIIVLLMTLMVEDAPPDASAHPDPNQPSSVTQLNTASGQLKDVHAEIKKYEAVVAELVTAPSPDALHQEIKTLEDEITKLTAFIKTKDADLRFLAMPGSEQAGVMADANAINQAIEKELAGKTDERDKLLDVKGEVLAALSKAKNNLFITTGPTDDKKTPAIIVVAGSGIEQYSMGKNDPEARHEAAAAPVAFTQILGTFDPASKYVLFYIKPSGIALFAQLLEEVRKTQFAVGYDALAENSTPKFGPPSVPATP